jgi:hypothetical protein
MRWPPDLKNEAELEAYVYFDSHIRPLPKKSDGSIDSLQRGFQDNDVDAFRHAYVSGIFCHEYGEKTANLLGWMNELITPSSPQGRNMDIWNNAIGRELARHNKTKDDLCKAVEQAGSSGELILGLSDNRIFQGAVLPRPEGVHSVIVLEEDRNGANKLFFDFTTSKTMTRKEFVTEIELGHFPGYTIRRIGNEDFPVSKQNQTDSDNLG